MTDPHRAARMQAALAQRLQSLVVVCEAIHRRHNASAILRSCEAFGLHEVHLVTGDFRPSKGAARGAERWMDVRVHETTTACLTGLKARGFAVYVADLGEQAHTPDTVPVDRPLALLFGSEVSGVTDEARALADGAVIVPMRGLTESLNVAAAATCALYRVAERRRALVGPDLPAEVQAQALAGWLAREERVDAGLQARVG
jgi:tRNA (guanosine-2'-O-)-methyltransferase